MRRFPTSQSVAALIAALVMCALPAAADEGVVSGQVRTASHPLPASQVYAYQLADLTLRKATTDEAGRFAFKSLPAGLYKIVAFKPGFVPGVALLTRASAKAVQILDVELRDQGAAAADSAADFWTVRQQIPTDVLRDIDFALAADESAGSSPRIDNLRAGVRAVTGVDSMATAQTAQLSGGEVELASEIDNVNVDVSGSYLALEAARDLHLPATDGYSQTLSVDVSGVGANRIRMTTVDNSLSTASGKERMGLQSQRLSWSRDGERHRSQVAAQYTEEDNFYARGGGSRLALPPGSRAWNLEGSYSTDISERSTMEAGFRYRDRVFELVHNDLLLNGVLPQERVEVFGRGGTSLVPAVLVEYGVYSTMRDGTLSFMPQGGLVMRLGDSWRASTSAGVKMHDDPLEARRVNDFHTAYFRDYASCERATAECYQVVLARFVDDQEKLSIGALHRRFDETLRLQFDQNFFNYRENLQLVHGDAVPELQIALTQRLSPTILARLESNLGAGGGGILTLADREHGYENEVRYFVTSLDTQFERSATGVFVAFHQLEQRLSPLDDQPRPAEQILELERLQLMLTQDLAVLGDLAADWAVQLNMELSRGFVPTGGDATLADEIRSRITGGLAVRF
ncbi:MAG: carboxypeptidase-like regulatory domain-containing protein [Acidobacteriota bacterium]|nr:carboxypeptidase-like regulatory domain-containing protein [Acidobacteriota bacterium]MDH3522581.1 carboxypeptidase-like regulatory domain-containing protein [Acidobacteriota bacterium]